MSDKDLEAKFRGLVADVLSDAAADEAMALCWRMSSLEDAGALARSAVPLH
jgi:hypothetical protein